ncbi:MAG: ribosome biogenesis GTPase Der [Candidatus Eremiobacteraeota bacterium]|nr:ribosome biogenesis GTPase Der [Candidatus Eremiobacteraeota bacterium]
MAKSIVAIVGRPNVGKSALLNRLISRRDAIVESTPGVTRDRIYRECDWNGRNFTLVDTGGILLHDADNLKMMIRLQVEVAIDEANLILFIVDVREGIHPLDQDVANLLRNSGKDIIVVANKVDNCEMEVEASEFYSLGWENILCVSAVHGNGTGDLLDLITDKLPPDTGDEVEENEIYISIVGRPNVGKSSLLNAITGEERAIVTPKPGTTRDAVDSTVSWGGSKFVIVDTAGLRRKAKIDDRIEYYSTHRAKNAIKRSQVSLLVIDASEPAVNQDKRIGGILDDEGKGVILVVNKWDLIEPDYRENRHSESMRSFEEFLREEMDFLRYAPILFTSALEKIGTKKILPGILKVYDECIRKIETSVVNNILHEAFFYKPPPSFTGKKLKLYYAFQLLAGPPTFILKVNSPKLLHFSYKRYLENRLRDALGFKGTPIRLIFKK